ncbi:MAG: GNAT family N-acetyltransferase, partial [Bacteroidota bacterium]
MKDFPQLKTKRLLLTELRSTDIPRVVQYASNKEVSLYTLNLPHPFSDKDAINWMNTAHQGFKSGSKFVFALRWGPEMEFIGSIGLSVDRKFNRAEISFWIAEPFWGRGFATEAVRAALQFGFKELYLNKLTSAHMQKNPASGKVLKNSGLAKEGILK